MAVELPEIARRTGLSLPAIESLREALVRGKGMQAQFNHPDLGGMGQWMRGGMVMIGDMFNTALATKVANACSLLAERVDVEVTSGKSCWWPREYGDPSMHASQDRLDYAYFPHRRLVAVRRDGHVSWYEIDDVEGLSAQGGQIIVHTSGGLRTLSLFEPIDPLKMS